MSGSPHEVVPVYTTNDVYEAEMLRNELRNEGIDCEVDGISQGGFTELVPCKLLVRAEDALRAREWIETRSAGDMPADDEQ